MRLLLVLFIAAVGERLFFDLGPNVELVTMATIMASVYSTHKLRYLLPLGIMFTTDWSLGVGVITFFTWSGFLVMGLIPLFISRGKTGINGVTAIGAGLMGSIWFFIWTNLGVWLTDSWGMYSRDIYGLIQCYVNAIPFFKANLISTLVWIPLAVIVMERQNLTSYVNQLKVDLTKHLS